MKKLIPLARPVVASLLILLTLMAAACSSGGVIPPPAAVTSTPPEPTSEPTSVAGPTEPFQPTASKPEVEESVAPAEGGPDALRKLSPGPTPTATQPPEAIFVPGATPAASPVIAPIPSLPPPTESPSIVSGPALSGGSNLIRPAECTGAGASLTAPPMDLEGLGFIVPMGRMQSSHVTPTDHTYFRPEWIFDVENQPSSGAAGAELPPWDPVYDAYSPAGGQIMEIGTFPFSPAPAGYSGEVGDYRLVIWHSCTTFSIFIHLSTLSQEILDVTGEIKSGDSWFATRSGRSLLVDAGQALGKVGSHGFDYSLHDTDVFLPGFVIPGHYGEPWKVHTVDPFDYFTEPLRASLQEKSLRTAPPVGGKIDYDIDGRLVGNWFLDGTVDYDGDVDLSACDGELCNYWSGHLAIAYDHIEPENIRISIGRDLGIDPEKCRMCQGVYAVAAGSQDPGEVSVAAGLIEYQLIARDFVDRTGQPERTYALEDQPLGVFMVRMEDDRTIRMEVFPDRTVGQVSGFSEASLIYRR